MFSLARCGECSNEADYTPLKMSRGHRLGALVVDTTETVAVCAGLYAMHRTPL